MRKFFDLASRRLFDAVNDTLAAIRDLTDGDGKDAGDALDFIRDARSALREAEGHVRDFLDKEAGPR